MSSATSTEPADVLGTLSTVLGAHSLSPVARYHLMRASEARVRTLVEKWQRQDAQGDPDFDRLDHAQMRRIGGEMFGDYVELQALLPSNAGYATSNAGYVIDSSAWAFGGAAVAGALHGALGQWAASLLALGGVAGWLYAPTDLAAAARDISRGVSASLLYLAARDLVRPRQPAEDDERLGAEDLDEEEAE